MTDATGNKATVMTISRDDAGEFHRRNKGTFPLELNHRLNELKNTGKVPRRMEDLRTMVKDQFSDTTEANRIMAFYKLYGFISGSPSPRKVDLEVKEETATPAPVVLMVVPAAAPAPCQSSQKRKEEAGHGRGNEKEKKRKKVDQGEKEENDDALPPNKQWQAETIVTPTITQGGTPLSFS
jgi:hypothetical protein